MNCWGMRNLILDSGTKEIQIQLASAPLAELHVTTHRYDHYKDVQDYGNRHGFSNWMTAETIVPAPNPSVCWKREVTSISVYNPNDAMQLFYIIEYDDATGVATVIDEKLLNPFESWTMDCICGCWNCGCGVNIYDEWDFIYANAYNLNFIGSCVNAARNNLTGMIDVNIDPTLSRTWCAWDTPYLLSVCWHTVDLSCLAWDTPLEIPVDETVYVMKNGSDITGLWERFDKPFLTINAAITAAVWLWAWYSKVITVKILPGIYTETVVLKTWVHLEFSDGAILDWSFTVPLWQVRTKVTWDWELIVRGTGAWNFAALTVTSSLWSMIDIHMKTTNIINNSTDASWPIVSIIDYLWTTWWHYAKFTSDSTNITKQMGLDTDDPMQFIFYVAASCSTEYMRSVHIELWYVEFDLRTILLKLFEVWDMNNLYIANTAMTIGSAIKNDLSWDLEFFINSSAWATNDIYIEWLKINWPFNSDELWAAFSLNGEGNKLSFNNTKFKLDRPIGWAIPAAVFIAPSAWPDAASTNRVYFYGDNDIYLSDAYNSSLWWLGSYISVYDVLWRVNTNKPYDASAMERYNPDGIIHVIYDSALPEQQMPYAAH